MRGSGGTRDPAGPGPGASRFGAAPATCPWGCVLGPGGWSGAPFCPRHRLPAAAEAERSRWQAAPQPPSSAIGVARDAFVPGPGLLVLPGRPEGSSEEEDEEEEEQEWIGFRQRWDVSSEDGDPPYGFYRFRDALLRREPPAARAPSALEVKMHRLPAPWGHRLTAEEAERNARELVAEEERMKRKAEKKKLKKKKQKDRKKREKLGQELKKQAGGRSPSSPSSAAGAGPPGSGDAEEGEGWPAPSPSPRPGDRAASSGEEGGGREARAEEMEDELDLSCTFVVKARQKAGVRLPAPGKERPPRPDDAEPGRRTPGKAPQPEPLDASAVQQSLVLAGRGVEAAQRGRYGEAVQAFTAAAKLNPREHRLFGNRSYCYEKLRRYEEALGDAQLALGLQPGWPKGFFRKGKALRGLERYAEAASAFEELLRLDGANAEAAVQLQACRALLTQSSPRSQSSPGGVPLSPSLPEAGEPPPPSGEWASGSGRDADAGGFVTAGSARSQARPAASNQRTLPPTIPPGGAGAGGRAVPCPAGTGAGACWGRRAECLWGRGSRDGGGEPGAVRQGLLPALGGERHCQDQRGAAAALLQPLWGDPLHPRAAEAALRLRQLRAEEGGGGGVRSHAGRGAGGQQAGAAAQAPLPRHPGPPAAPGAPRCRGSPPQGPPLAGGGGSPAYSSAGGPRAWLPALPFCGAGGGCRSPAPPAPGSRALPVPCPPPGWGSPPAAVPCGGRGAAAGPVAPEAPVGRCPPPRDLYLVGVFNKSERRRRLLVPPRSPPSRGSQQRGLCSAAPRVRLRGELD
ncbi:LOW QUALITY PROTEIN: tetratricopeptide repeat protein 31 [Chlamydotis macqueenii]